MHTIDPDFRRRVKQITEKIITIPTLPTVVSKMLELVDNPKTSAKSLGNLIATDQALTARILKMANSAYYGFSREIYTVDMAVVVMGFNAVKEMGLSLSVFDIFKDLSKVHHFDMTQFWYHSIGSGISAKIIARHVLPSMVSEAFVAGLLHDIGKVVLNQYLTKEFTDIIYRVARNNECLDDVEMEMLGTTHAEIGGWLAEKWRLPRIISESIHFHHEPWNAPKSQLHVSLINLANHLCHYAQIGNSGRKPPLEIDERTWNILHSANIDITRDTLYSFCTELFVEFDQTQTLTSMLPMQ